MLSFGFDRKAGVNFDTTQGIGKEHEVRFLKIKVYVSQISQAARSLAHKINLWLGEGIQLRRVRAFGKLRLPWTARTRIRHRLGSLIRFEKQLQWGNRVKAMPTKLGLVTISACRC